MNIVHKVTLQHMKQNKKRTLVTMIGIMISTAMLTAVATTAFSFQDVLARHVMERTGNWHVLYKDVPVEKAAVILEDDDTKSAMITRNAGYSELKESKNIYKPYLYLKEYDENAFYEMPVHLVEGRFPENENEIVIPEHINANGEAGIEIGDKIKFTPGKRVIEGEDVNLEQDVGLILKDNDSKQPEALEVLEAVGEEKEYTVTGIIERPDFEEYQAPGYTVITYLDRKKLSSEDRVNVSVMLKHIRPGMYEKAEALALELGLTKEDISFNKDVLGYYGVTTDSSYNRMMLTLAVILVVIIIVGSVSLIYNAFAISVSERSRYLGMLSSVGATKKQKRSSVFFEGFMIGCVSIPLGILAGTVGMAVTFYFVNPLFLKIAGIEEELKVVISPVVVVVSAILSALTIFISVWVPAKRASKITPIDAIRRTKDISLKQRTIKTLRITRTIFGFEGDLALKNLKRYKKRYRATVFSFIISIILFLTVSGFTYYLQKAYRMSQEGSMKNYDLLVREYNNGAADEKTDLHVIEKILGFGGIESYSVLTDVNLDLSAALSAKEIMSQDYLSYLSERSEVYDVDAVLADRIRAVIYGLDDESLREYCQENGIEYESMKNTGSLGAVVINKTILQENYSAEELTPWNLKRGNSLMLEAAHYNEEGEEEILPETVQLKIVGTTEETPVGVGYSSYVGQPVIVIVSEDTADRIIENYIDNAGEEDIKTDFYKSKALSAVTSDPGMILDKIENELSEEEKDHIYVNSEYENNKNIERMLTLISVFAYGFISLITLICIANIWNTISTSIALRRREFAMLRSVGMTPEAFNRMIIFESLFYGIKALLYGLPVGFLIMVGIYKVVSGNFGQSFSVPVGSFAIVAAAVFLVVTSSMMYSVSKVKKENMIDALKME
jgi:putative ABC transport system permease protein